MKLLRDGKVLTADIQVDAPSRLIPFHIKVCVGFCVGLQNRVVPGIGMLRHCEHSRFDWMHPHALINPSTARRGVLSEEGADS